MDVKRTVKLEKPYRLSYQQYKHSLYGFFMSLCLLALSFAQATQAEIYSWKDEHGRVHFGDRKLEQVQQETVELDVQQSQFSKFDIEINDVDSVLTEDEVLRIKQDVNAVYQFYDRVLFFDIYKTVPVKIRLYEKAEDFYAYLSSKGANKRNVRGVYFRSTNEIVLPLNKKEHFRTFWTIKHEVSHAICDTLTPFVPSWFNEGIAENMETLERDESGLFLAWHVENHASLKRGLQREPQHNIKDFLAKRSDTFYKDMQSSSPYNQAHAGELVRLLLSNKVGRNFIVRLIHYYSRGERLLSHLVFEEHYLGGLPVLQNQWNRWRQREQSETIYFK